MANNLPLGGLPATNAFQLHQNPARRAVILVRAGIFTASTAVSAALKPLPGVLGRNGACISYLFYISLAMLFLFGMWLIVLGWRVADNSTAYRAVSRAAIRVSQIVLVFAVALHEIHTISTVSVGTAISGIFQIRDLIEELNEEERDDDEEAWELGADTEAATTSSSWVSGSHETGTADGTGTGTHGIGVDEVSSDSWSVSTSAGEEEVDCIESDAESRSLS